VAHQLLVDPPSSPAIREALPVADYTPSRLLAGRDRLGRIEKDAIFEQVLVEVAPRRRAWWWFALPAFAAAALALVLVWPRASSDEFTAKGGGEAVASFAPTCGAPCARGGKLLFDLQGTTGYRYFSAFARGSAGNVIWYATARELGTALNSGVLDETVLLGDEHPPGTYRVYGVFSQTALDKDGIKVLFDDSGRVRPAPGVAVVEKELVIR
jgi:hypothetical protein